MRLPDYKPTIDGLVHHIAAKYGDAEAIVRDGERLTFRELESRSALIAKALLAQGAAKGTRIGLLMPPTPDYALLLLAIGRIGAVALPLSTLYQAPELQWVLANAEIDHLVTVDRFLSHDYLARLEEALPGLADSRPPFRLAAAPRLRTVWVAGEGARAWSRPVTDLFAGSDAFDDAMLRGIEDKVAPGDPYVIIHTSGSTANPKGVIHGQGAFVRHSYQMAMDFYPFGEGDRVITTRAMFWVAGLVATLFYALQAGVCVITTNDGSPENVLRLIHDERGTGLGGDSGWFDVLRDSVELRDAGYDVVRLNMDKAAIARSGRYLSAQVARRFGAARHYPNERFARTFGMTETLGGHTSARWDELLPEDRPSWQGKPVPGVELKIVDPKTREPLSVGETGELLVKGYCLMLGLTSKERDEVFDAEGFYATGDLCTLDAQGYLKFEARLGEMIKIHGANVAPMEVELAMTGLMGIEKVAVVGVPKGHDVELTAAVLMAPGRHLDPAEVTAELKRRLSSFKVPRRIVAMTEDTLPMTGSGKVKKAELVAMLTDAAI
ncbi:MAG: acyl--CoA ligase [Novosphingobium sp.]|nr:acyl--CoA ligase [Novosphingobium sp.]